MRATRADYRTTQNTAAILQVHKPYYDHGQLDTATADYVCAPFVDTWRRQMVITGLCTLHKTELTVSAPIRCQPLPARSYPA